MFNIIPDTEAFNERYTVIYPLGEFIVRLPDGQEVSLIPTKFVDQVAAYEAEPLVLAPWDPMGALAK